MFRGLALVSLMTAASCTGGGDDSSLPPAVTPSELVESAMQSPGDGSDVWQAIGCFGTADVWRNAPGGMVVSKRGVGAIVEATDASAKAATAARSSSERKTE